MHLLDVSSGDFIQGLENTRLSKEAVQGKRMKKVHPAEADTVECAQRASCRRHFFYLKTLWKGFFLVVAGTMMSVYL